MENAMNGSNGTPRPEVQQLVRQDFAGTSISRENQATASLVAKARADIEARWTMAIHRPRNMDKVRTALLAECRRPNFAEVAIYRKPVGDGIEGLSIRFAEAAARCFGNVAMEVSQIYEDRDVRIMRVSATDLESNVTWPQDVTVAKTVERRQLRKGQTMIAQRTNNNGDTVYIVEATDDDMLNKQGALVSKALRTCILRIIPGNLQDESYEVCNAIMKDKAAKDPDAARNAMCDAFAAQGIQPNALEEWLGHELQIATPVEIEQLRRLYVAVRDGEATWVEALAARHDAKPSSKFDAAVERVAAKGAKGVKDALKKKETTTPAAEPAPLPKVTDAEREQEPAWMAGGAPEPAKP